MATHTPLHSNPAEPPDVAGVPLGGVGAGCIELGRDARFRNITINNNRTAALRIPVSQGGFLAVRAVRRGKVLARILHPETGLPFERAGIVPTYTPTEQLSWRGLYPCAHYQLADAQFPIEVKWTALSPIIPHDLAASTLPVVLFAFHLRNLADSVVEAAVLMNWENLCGCDRSRSPEDRGRIALIAIGQDRRFHVGTSQEVSSQGGSRIMGLRFGSEGPYAHNAEGNYCLLTLPQAETAVSVGIWNERDPDELQRFWQRFHDEGRLGPIQGQMPDFPARNRLSHTRAVGNSGSVPELTENHSGAVCCSVTLAAGDQRDLVVALAWYCPRFEVHGRELGNAYAAACADSLAVAQKALQSYQGYFRRVGEWQQRLLQSSLPDWLSRALINSSHVLSTNSILTRDGRFAMMESACDPFTGAMDRRLYSSLGTLLLFPELEVRELELLARAEDSATPGRFYRYVGTGSLHEPGDGPGGSILLETGIKLVLQAYRNYLMTGRKDAVERLFPRLQRAMAYVIDQDRDGDGLPEHDGFSTTYDAWAVQGVSSYTSSLWIAALRAYARLAGGLGQVKEANRYETLVPPALASFEQRLWDEDIAGAGTRGYYRFYRAEGQDVEPEDDPGTACHTGQLAGQWYADFLGLGRLFPSDHIRKAMEAICTLNERPGGLVEGVMPDGKPCRNPAGSPADTGAGLSWPGLCVHFLGLLMHHGYPDRALYIAGRQVDSIHRKRGRTFNQPLCWNLDTNDAQGGFHDRHISAMSVWHVFHALQGFLWSVPDETVWVRPNLPRGVHGLSAPLFTPLAIGWLNFLEDDEAEPSSGGYRQRVRITLETRLQLKTIVVRVPAQVEEVAVQLTTAPLSASHPPVSSSAVPACHQMIRDGDQCLVQIAPESPMGLSGVIEIALRQTKGKPVRFPRPAS